MLAMPMFCARDASAQNIGIAALLNPEGSRLFPQSVLFPRHPGKPDPRWKSFEWRYADDRADSSKFRFYFYTEEEWAARFALPRVRREVQELTRTFNYSPKTPFSYLLFTSQREFSQANIFNISEGVQGITSTEEATMAIPYWGETQTFDHISAHEMVHQFQVQKINELGDIYAADRMALIPLWFIEGMAEYYSLKGIDPESRVYLRDLMVNVPEGTDTKEHKPPTFFDEGAFDFVNIYKVGQAKVAFLEKTYGKGVSQRILETSAKVLGGSEESFKTVVAKETGKKAEEVEEAWKKELEKEYKAEAQARQQSHGDFKPVSEAGETMDFYELSPDGKVLVYRDIDPLTGRAAIKLLDLERGNRRLTVVEDRRPGALSLYFFQFPSIALANNRLGYVVETSFGPELETRDLERDDGGELRLGKARRLKLHELNILQVPSIAFSPDGRHTAIAGVGRDGKANVFVAQGFPENGAFRLLPLTEGYYSWKNLSWTEKGLLASSDRTANGRYALFRLDPENGRLTQLTSSPVNQLEAVEVATGDAGHGIVFQSWESGTPQAELLSDGKLTRLTDFKTSVARPRLSRGELFFLGFAGGRFHILRGKPGSFGTRAAPPVVRDPGQAAGHAAEKPWTAELDSLDPARVESYKPFSSSGKRIDNLLAFFASGGFLGIAGTASDLMRDYAVSVELTVLGRLNRTSASAFLTSQRGRSTWTLGAYRTIQPRLDTIFPTEDAGIRTYLHREAGALGAWQYPFGAFSYIDAELRLGGVSRDEFSDPSLNDSWQAQNPGTEFLLSPTLRYGFDRVLYEGLSGPIEGFGALFEVDTSYFPGRGAVSERFRIDVANYWKLPGRTALAFNGMGAFTTGDRYRSTFLVSSDDILRAYPFNDDRLYGNYLLAGKLELRFPLGTLFGFPYLRGLAAYDLGSVWVNPGELGSRITSSATGGFTLNFPPISINFMVSKPLRTAPGPQDSSVAHFTLRYLYI